MADEHTDRNVKKERADAALSTRASCGPTNPPMPTNRSECR